jgi:HlyD family secretion protein
MKRVLIIGVLLVAAGAGIWFFAGRGNEIPLLFYGNVDIREVNLSFRVPGRIESVLKNEGDPVAARQMVATLDAEPYRREVEEAGAQAESREARLRMLKNGYRKEEINEAQALVAEREATLENARRDLKRTEQLRGTRAISVRDLDAAEADFDEAQARLNSALATLHRLRAGYRLEEISQAEADLAAANAALELARIRLEDTKLIAPEAGVVITRALEPGATVSQGVTVLTVSLDNPVWVRAYVNESNLGKIYPGMPVKIFTDSRPEKPYDGQVGFISPRAEFTPKTVETPDLRTSLVYRFRVVVTEPDAGLRQGMPVTVRLDER